MTKKKEIYSVTPKVVETEKIMTSGYDEIFTLVTKQGKVFIAVADKICSKNAFNSEEEAQQYIDSKPWDLLINVACICFEIINKQKQ